MTHPAADIRAAIQAAFPGATVDARGKNWLRLKHPTQPGRFITEYATVPIHYGDASDQEIDTAIVADTGAWQWKMLAADFQFHARSVFNAGNIIEYRDRVTQEWVIFDPQSINWTDETTSRQQIAIKQAVTGVVTDDVLNFPAAWGAGLHFRYQAGTGRLRKVITIDSAANLPAETLAGTTIWLETEFTLSTSAGVDVYLDGVKWAKTNGVRVQTAGRVEFRDAATGTNVLWSLDLPRAWDSLDNRVIGQMEVRRQGGASNLFVTIRIPKAWVDTAAFPIFIDPTIDIGPITVSADYGTEDASTNNGNGQWGYFNSGATYQWFGARFTGITIPSGATINSGYVAVNSLLGTPNDDMNSIITFQKSATPGQFVASGTAQMSGATATTASVTWSDLNLPTGWNNSPDLTSILQELATAYTYSSGAMVARLHQATLTCYLKYEVDYAGLGPKLHIDYTAASTSPSVAGDYSLFPKQVMRPR